MTKLEAICLLAVASDVERDALNHVWASEEEVWNAFHKLHSANLLTTQRLTDELTDAGKAAVGAITRVLDGIEI